MRSYFGAMVLCLMAAASAVAQPPEGGFDGGPGNGPGGSDGRGRFGPPPNPMFTAIDLDGDGVITKRELRKAVANLKTLDADGDGNLTQEEASPQRGSRVDRIMESDQDGDGKLSREEIPPWRAEMLQDADKNGDGLIDRDEVSTAVENSRGPGGFFGGQGGGPSGGEVDPQQMVQQLMQGDRNGDGVLTNEVPMQAMFMLQGADQNQDESLDLQEIQAAVERARERGGRGYGDRGRNGEGPGRDDQEPGGPQQQ